MNKTQIEWVKNPEWQWTDDTGTIHVSGGEQGYTWNPITGCLNHVNGMCKGGNFPCYAYRLAHGRLRSRYLAKFNLANIPCPNKSCPECGDNPVCDDPFYPRLWTERQWEADGGKPKGIFVCDMSDLFGIGIPKEWQDGVFEAIVNNPQHRFYLLTKQPQNLVKFSPFPDNCWVGVTVCNDSMMKPALNALMDIEAKSTFISFEPLLSSINVGGIVASRSYRWLDWVIIGACTGTLDEMVKLADRLHIVDDDIIPIGHIKYTLQPNIEWVREIVEACDKAGIPVFLKNNLWPLFSSGEPSYWAINNSGFLRQEFPK